MRHQSKKDLAGPPKSILPNYCGKCKGFFHRVIGFILSIVENEASLLPPNSLGADEEWFLFRQFVDRLTLSGWSGGLFFDFRLTRPLFASDPLVVLDLY